VVFSVLGSLFTAFVLPQQQISLMPGAVLRSLAKLSLG
jgi:hypothetical protein